MIIDINPLLKGEKNEISVDFELTLSEGVDDVEFPYPFHISGFVKDMAGYILLSLNASTNYRTQCARCLKDISKIIEVSFEKTVISDISALQNKENDDYILAPDGYIDVDETLTEQIILEIPMKHLCKDDCKGLCFKCGADLNVTECTCDTSDPDPRFDVLRKLLEKNKND